ncbi:MAG: ComF family protein [Dehalococcoidia bacterium]|nr:ComF family protein [Dehalococcoidia bacterium]
MGRDLKRLVSAGLDLLFPPRCCGCGGPGGLLCQGCEASAPTLELPYCGRCAHPGSHRATCGCGPLAVDGIRAPYLLEGPVRKAVHDLKYRNLRAAAPRLGGLLAAWMEKTSVPGELLVPIPLHRRQLRSRGYNQSAMLAREVSKGTGLALARDALARVRDSAPQVSLPSRLERARNVEGGFRCVGDVRGARVVLVDDVVTTGSTMSACAEALKSAGARSVWGIALARQPYRAA